MGQKLKLLEKTSRIGQIEILQEKPYIWGEPEQAPHKRFVNVHSIYMYGGTSVT